MRQPPTAPAAGQRLTARRASVVRRVVVAAVLAIAALLLGLFGLWCLANARTYQVAGDLVWRVDTSEPVVALTFDDGPEPSRVEPILSLLRAADIKATFFVIGESLAESPVSGRRLVEEGHQLGNHSYTHDRMVFRSGDFYAREIVDTD